MSKTTYHTDDTVWYFAVDPDTDPSGWISDKKFTLYCRDKKIMRKAKKSFVHKHKGHK